MDLEKWIYERRSEALFFAAMWGTIEAFTIWFAVSELGKHAVLPFISWCTRLGLPGLFPVVFLRLLLVYLCYRWNMHYINIILFFWWCIWSVLNLL